MAITYEKVIQESLNLLGAVKGATASAAEAAYTATPDTSTVIGPDFLASQVADAIAMAQGEIVEAIASTPKHPERQRYADVTASLANLAAIPRTGAGTSKLIIGVLGFVRDASDSQAVEPAPLDAVRSYNRFISSVYSGFDAYLYAINGNRIEHTRTNVVIEVCVYERPASLSGNIDLDDHHEGALVQGAVSKLALKESMFGGLQAGAKKQWDDYLAGIRGYGNPDLYGKAQSAPSST